MHQTFQPFQRQTLETECCVTTLLEKTPNFVPKELEKETPPILELKKSCCGCGCDRYDQFGGHWDEYKMIPQNSIASAFVEKWGPQE